MKRHWSFPNCWRQNFLRYDGKGEFPSPIHSYLSSNFKELRNLAKDDPVLKPRAKDRWYVPDPNKAGDLERTARTGPDARVRGVP